MITDPDFGTGHGHRGTGAHMGRRVVQEDEREGPQRVHAGPLAGRHKHAPSRRAV